MAKLSANGRKALARVFVETSTPDGELTTWNRTTRALMSDGVILSKLDVRFRSDGRPHSYGWTVLSRKCRDTADQFIAKYEKVGYQRA